jgi:homoaconitate hydratase
MKVRDSQLFLDKIDWTEYDKMRAQGGSHPTTSFEYSEPKPLTNISSLSVEYSSEEWALPSTIHGRVQRFGDSIDTDSVWPSQQLIQIIPADKCMQMDGNKVSGKGAFCYYRLDFYDKAQAGATIIVAGKCFGSGSSREQAPIVLQSAGIKAIIAKSYAFIYARNQANNGLLGIRLETPEFYSLAQEGADISVDMEHKVITCQHREFEFELDPIEEALLRAGGLLSVYEIYGSSLFRKLQSAGSAVVGESKVQDKRKSIPLLIGNTWWISWVEAV